MNLATARRHCACKGGMVARAAGPVTVMAGLAAAVGLLMAGDGWEAHAVVDSANPCASPANAAFAAL